MSDIAERVATEQCFAIQYEDKGTNRFMSVRFWKGQCICKVLVCRSELPASEPTGELGLLSRLLSVISTKADVVACSGSPADLIRTIDQAPTFVRGIQSCFRFERLDLLGLMHKTSYSVFGHIDFFSVLRGLMISLCGSPSKAWVQRSPELARVSVLLVPHSKEDYHMGKKSSRY